MAKNSDSILGCAALLREAEHRSARAFTYWTEANLRYRQLVEREMDEIPGPTAMDTAWLQATAGYESMLDAQREKFVLRTKLTRLKKDNEKRRAIPIRSLPNPAALTRGQLDTRAMRYCRLRATGATPRDALQMAGYTPGVMDPDTLERDRRVIDKIAAIRRDHNLGGEEGDMA